MSQATAAMSTDGMGGCPILLKLVFVCAIYTVGAPSFRFCAKGWAAQTSIISKLETPRGISPWFPPLQRTQEWGTLCHGGLSKTKDGPPAQLDQEGARAVTKVTDVERDVAKRRLFVAADHYTCGLYL